MSKRTIAKCAATAAVCSYAYACVYAIQTTPITLTRDGMVSKYVARSGETDWPCSALLFDRAEDALATILSKGLVPDGNGYPRVVLLQLGATVKPVSVAKKTRRVVRVA
jgi:hypothetical protein